MIKQIFVNLPVKDLVKTRKFWEDLGFSFNPQFSDDKGAALVLGENIYVMLLTEPFYKSFLPQKEISDATKTSEVINAVSVETKEAVDQLVDKAFELGATKYRDPDTYEWMYNRSFQDLDGHLWEVASMDMSKFPQTPA